MANTQNNPKKKMRLGAFFNPTGHHVASWRHAESQADAGINIAHYRELAQTAERAKFDMIFLADNVCVRKAHIDALSPLGAIHRQFRADHVAVGAVRRRPSHIGLVATATTSYNEPYHVARKFASLDHISGGRAGWNLVTSGQQAEAQNFGRDAHYGHSERYERAREFAEVVTALWDSWDDDAFVARQGERRRSSIRESCTCSITRASISRCAGRSTCRARRKAGRCIVQAGASERT